MPTNLPTVMVSSTFYDLRELRHQLVDFIQNHLGYRAFLSEASTFPVDPDVTAIENCRRRVEEDIDLLVLVIGRRYGAIEAQSGKSITNLEYLAARAKGIPVFVYVEQGTLTLFDAWESSGSDARSALGQTVEDARLFEFIKQVRQTDGVWTVGFSTATDIINSLRTQLAYQMSKGLGLSRSLRVNADRELLQTLRGRAFRIAVERPSAWEYLLFAQTLADEVQEHADLRREYDLGLRTGSSEHLTELTFPGWVQVRLGEMTRVSEAANSLVNDTLQKALGPPGVAGNAADLVFVARRLAKLYVESIQWALRIRRAHPPAEDFSELLDALASFSDSLIEKIGRWGTDIVQGIEESLAEVKNNPPGSAKREIRFTLSLEATGTERFLALVRDVYGKRGMAAE